MNYNQYMELAFHTRTQAHVFHFQTTSFAEHKALEEFYSQLPELLDNLIESAQGKTQKRVKVETQKNELKDWSSVEDSKKLVKHLEDVTTKQIDEEEDEGLKDLCIDILNHCHKVMFLLTLS